MRARPHGYRKIGCTASGIQINEVVVWFQICFRIKPWTRVRTRSKTLSDSSDTSEVNLILRCKELINAEILTVSQILSRFSHEL